jgi:hypothetical protein
MTMSMPNIPLHLEICDKTTHISHLLPPDLHNLAIGIWLQT